MAQNQSDVAVNVVTNYVDAGMRKTLADMRMHEVELKKNQTALRQQSQLATQNLGMNLGLLFSIMGVGNAITQTTSYMVKYGIVSEKTGKKVQEVSGAFRLMTSWVTSALSVYMLWQAVEGKRAQKQLNKMALDAGEIQFMRQKYIATMQQVAAEEQLTRTTGELVAAKGMDIGADRLQTISSRAKTSQYVNETAIDIGRKGVSTWGVAVPILLGVLGTAVAGALGYMAFAKHQFGTDEMVTSPRIMLVGESGPEHVSVTPAGNRNGNSNGITININAPIYGVNDVRKVIAQAVNSSQRSMM